MPKQRDPLRPRQPAFQNVEMRLATIGHTRLPSPFPSTR
jgi:hypothetical protein